MYLSATEVCDRLRVSRDTLTKLIKSGDLKASKIGPHHNSHYRIKESDVDAYLDRQAEAAASP